MRVEQVSLEQNQNTSTPNSHSLDWLVSNLRWVWLIIIAFIVLAQGYLAETPSPDRQTLIILIGLGFFLNAIYAGLLWAKFFPGWLAAVATLVDIIFVIALLVIFSEYAQFLIPVALFPVIIAGIRWNVEAGLLTAVFVSLGYALPLISLFQSDDVSRSALAGALVIFSVNMVTLVLAGMLPALFVNQRVHATQAENEAELEHLRIANAHGRLLSEMAFTLSTTLDYRKVLRATIDAAFAAMAEIGTKDESAIAYVLLFEESDEVLTVAAGRNMSRNDQGRKISATEGLIGRTINAAEAVITNNAQNDKSISAFASTPGCRSAICAPLRAGYRTYGAILFCSTIQDIYNQEHRSLLVTFCNQAIIALQNAQLFEDIQQEQQKILDKEAEARKKLARDLHDGPTQSVAAIVMRLNFIKMVLQNDDVEKALDEVVKVEEIAQRTTHEIRTMLFAMRPVILETQGLIPALTQYAERLNKNEPFNVTLSNRGYDGQLNSEAEGVVFAIVEEAVGNAKKHAQASAIKINLIAKKESLFVEVADNGVGFDVASTQSTYDQRSSLGLINMDERAELVGGQCLIQSARGEGTTISLEIPYVKNNGD